MHQEDTPDSHIFGAEAMEDAEWTSKKDTMWSNGANITIIQFLALNSDKWDDITPVNEGISPL